MRKHFLILMLLTLLPMATWAIDITGKAVTFDPAGTSAAYDGVEHNLPAVVSVADATGALSVQWFYGESTTPLTVLKYKNAGTYTVKVTSSNDTGVATATFTVTPVAVAVNAKAITTGVTYGDEVSAVTALGQYEIDIDDILAADKHLVGTEYVVNDGVIGGSVTGYTTTYTKGTAIGSTSTITPIVTGLTSTNYTFVGNPANVTVGKKALTTAMIKSVGDSRVYTGANQVPADIQMFDEALADDDDDYLVKGTDYTFIVTLTTAETAVEAINAGTYRVRVTGKGNYKGTVTQDFTISKAPLLIQTKGDGTSANYKKVYDGTLKTWTTSDATVSPDDYTPFLDVQGYVDDDDAGTDGLQFEAEDHGLQLSIVPVASGTGSTDGNAGAYKLKIAPKAGESWSTLFPNYQVTNLNNGNYTIEKLEYGFTVTDQYISYDEANPFANDIPNASTYITVTTHTPAYALPTGFSITTYPTIQGVNVTGKGSYDLTMVANTAVIVKNGATAAENVDKTANFDIKLTKGKLHVAGGVIAVIPDAMSFTYGATAPAPTYTIVGLRDGESASDVTALNNVVKKYIYYSDGLDAGTHNNKILVDAEKIYAELPATLKANYESISPFKATYTIAKRQLTKIIVADQSINYAETAAALIKNEENVTFEADGYEVKDYDYERLITEYNFKFTDFAYMTPAEVTAETTANTAAKTADNYAGMDATAQAAWDAAYAAAHPNFGLSVGDLKRGTTANAITIALVGTGFKNFELPKKIVAGVPTSIDLDTDGDATGTKGLQLGKLTVTAATAELAMSDLGTAATLPATLLNAKKGGKVTAVKVTLNRNQAVGSYNDTWEAKKWNAMILPFDITVDDLADVIGYCIVNVASGNSTADKVSFKLEMDKIPANTPFMVKTTKRVAAGTQWNFKTQTIANADFSEDPEVDAGAGNKFVGTYKGVTIDKNNTNWRWNAGTSWPHFGDTSASSYIVRPFCAYMQIAEENAARDIIFEFEELDGSTTAINSIDADFTVVNAKGWYTVNGMKLNAAPTEKGIYINNGKKVVVK